MNRTTTAGRRAASLIAATIGVVGITLIGPVPPGHAAPGPSVDAVQQVTEIVGPVAGKPRHHGGHHGRGPKHPSTHPDATSSRGARVLAAAASKAGSPYVWGAAGPAAFDCSGLTMWAYARVGETLPHSSAAQVGRTVRVAHPIPGDLVFFTSGGSVYHVALYAGAGTVLHASQPGSTVGRARIWTDSVFYGRVR